jgi:hypothetical protein
MSVISQDGADGAQTPKAPAIGRSKTPQAAINPRTSRITTRLLIKTTQLNPMQLAAASGALLITILLGIWLLTPVVQGTWFWFNVPLISMVAPFAFAATRRRWSAAIAQITVAMIGGAFVWFRLGYAGDLAGLFAGALASAAAIEGMTLLLPRIMGNLKPDDPGAWQREAGWLGFAAVIGYVLLSAIAFGSSFTMNIVAWIFAFILGVAGWFLGDLMQGYLLLKQTGVKWR